MVTEPTEQPTEPTEPTGRDGRDGLPEPDGSDDAALLAAHVAGDPDAFATLVARHRDRLWAVALRTTGDPETAADALQDAFVSAFRRAGSFRAEARVTTWLHRIVVNACLDRLRAARVRRTEPLPDEPDAADRLEHQLARRGDGAGSDGLVGLVGVAGVAGTVGPEQHALVEDRRRAVRAALAELPADQRAAVVLVDMEGYPVAEAAEILDCPVGTVKSRCSRARARLAGLLASYLVEEAGEQDHAVLEAAEGNRPRPADVGSRTRRGPPAASREG